MKKAIVWVSIAAVVAVVIALALRPSGGGVQTDAKSAAPVGAIQPGAKPIFIEFSTTS